jgi:hypothetical protein
MASIRCGKCKGTHESVTEVRACYGAHVAVTTQAQARQDSQAYRKATTPTTAQHNGNRFATVNTLRTLVRDEIHETFPQHDSVRVAVALAGETDVRFFKIDVPRTGKYAGFVFIKEQAGSELWPVKGLDRQVAILTALRADEIMEWVEMYGRELGYCALCGRELTDAESRERGIGPVCLGKAA